MPKYLFLLIIPLLILALSFFYEENPQEEVKGEKKLEQLVLGYCDTFEKYAIDLAEERDLELKKFDNSSEVLENLRTGSISYAVIGRKAYSFEINDEITEIPLEDLGHTLVAPEKDIIEYSELSNVVVHTYLEEGIVGKYLPSETEVIYHENVQEALEKGISLISWEDLNDNLNLLIPLEGHSKVVKFRTPMLYTH
jgi:hypothetical protein